MSISKIRESAREALTGKWSKGALITLAYLAIYFVLGFIQGLFEENSVMSTLFGIAMIIIEVPISLGLVYAFMKLKRGGEVKAFDFLDMGFSNFGRAWKITLRTLLKLIFPIIVIIVSMLLMSGSLVSLTAEVIIGSAGRVSLFVMFVGIIIYIASLIWCMVRSLLYSLALYVAFDNPNMTSLEVVNESARMMNGNRGKIFLLELSFIGWAILAVLTLGIGYLWLAPYMQVALVCFYEHLLGKNEDNNSESNDEPIIEN